MKTISIGCDHAGFPYKDAIIKLLEERGIGVLNFGTDSLDSVDYPDFAHPTASAVEDGKADAGILLCGSGNGVAMSANKHQGIRAALCWNTEIAEMARLHNNANMICVPVRYVSEETALDMIKTFLETEFEGGRHQRRVGKIIFNC